MVIESDLSFPLKQLLHLIALKKDFYKNLNPLKIKQFISGKYLGWWLASGGDLNTPDYCNTYCLICYFKWSNKLDSEYFRTQHGEIHLEEYKNLIPFL